jgi:hypothetical protein
MSDEPAKPKAERPAVAEKKPAQPKPAGVKPAPQSQPIKVPTPASFAVSAQAFQVLSDEEVGALGSAGGILGFLEARAGELAQSAGGAALRWATAQALRIFGFGVEAEIDRIKGLLEEVLAKQREILAQLGKVLQEIEFQNLITRSFDSFERITSTYQSLRDLADVRDEQERRRVSERIQEGILAPNQGAALDLKVISDVLLGREQAGQAAPLITLLANRYLPKFLSTQLDPGQPLSTYPRTLDMLLQMLFMTQYMGLAELANALVKSGDFETLKIQLDRTIKNMQAQRALLDEAIPDFTRTLPDALFNGSYHVVRVQTAIPKPGPDYFYSVLAVLGRTPSSSGLLDGGPFAPPPSFSVVVRNPRENTGGEEWMFEKARPADATDDTFFLRVRSTEAPAPGLYLAAGGSGLASGPKAKAQTMRLVMGRTLDEKVSPDTKPRDLYLPVLAFVPLGEYLVPDYASLLFVHQGVVQFGSNEPLAARVRIEPAGH